MDVKLMQVLFDHTNKRNDVDEEEETTWEINEHFEGTNILPVFHKQWPVLSCPAIGAKFQKMTFSKKFQKILVNLARNLEPKFSTEI
jgi:hypothetical protein